VSIYDLDFYPLLIDPHCIEQQPEPTIDLAPECVCYLCQTSGMPRKLPVQPSEDRLCRLRDLLYRRRIIDISQLSRYGNGTIHR
jgi:hypothetical protein